MTIDAFIKDIKKNGITDIIFDFDETLATLDIDWGAWEKAMTTHIREYEPTFSTSYSQGELNALTRKSGKEFRDKVIKVNATAEKQNYKGYTVNEIAVELLKACAKVSRVHLWTSNDLRTVGPLLIEMKIDRYFATTIFSGDVMYLKPDPIGFEKINIANQQAEKFVFVGDSAADRGAAEALGMKFVDVRDLEE